MKHCATIWLQRQKEPKARVVAATVATLSPRSKRSRTRVVAAVADVATTRKAITPTTAIIQCLKEEGAHLYVTDNTLCFRPTDWAQLRHRECALASPLARSRGSRSGAENDSGR